MKHQGFIGDAAWTYAIGEASDEAQRLMAAEGPPGQAAEPVFVYRHILCQKIPMTIERDELGFDAPAPLGHPGRLGLHTRAATYTKKAPEAPTRTLPDRTLRTPSPLPYLPPAVQLTRKTPKHPGCILA